MAHPPWQPWSTEMESQSYPLLSRLLPHQRFPVCLSSSVRTTPQHCLIGERTSGVQRGYSACAGKPPTLLSWVYVNLGMGVKFTKIGEAEGWRLKRVQCEGLG